MGEHIDTVVCVENDPFFLGWDAGITSQMDPSLVEASISPDDSPWYMNTYPPGSLEYNAYLKGYLEGITCAGSSGPYIPRSVV